MRRVVLSVFAVFTVFAVVAVSAVPAFALDLTLEKYVECDIPEFLSYEGEDLASAVDLFDSLTGLTMYVAIKESLNGVNDPSYDMIKSYYSDIDASSDQDAMNVFLLVLPAETEKDWKLSLVPSEKASELIDDFAPTMIQFYFDELYEDEYLTEYCLSESIRLIAEGIQYGYAEHAVEAEMDPEEEYTVDYEIYEYDPYLGMSEEEYNALVSQMEPLMPDFDEKSSIFSSFDGSDWIKLLCGILVAVAKVFAKKQKKEKDE